MGPLPWRGSWERKKIAVVPIRNVSRYKAGVNVRGAGMNMKLVPDDFVLPSGLKADSFTLRPLRITDVVKDYDAVMTSVEHLQGVFGEYSKWPSPDLTLEQDLIDLGWHHKEFQRRSSFAYTVMNRDESECLGCLYIYPSLSDEFEVDVYMWVRKSEYDKGLDPVLFSTVRSWLETSWPFKRLRYPGRS